MTLKSQLIRDEGLRLMPYRDSVGKLTIGIGRNLDDRGISSEEAEHMLDNDILQCRLEVRSILPWIDALDDARRGVLLNMAFNLGTHGLLKFERMLAAAQTGEWETAASEMLDSKWAGQVGERATRLAEQMRTGIWK